MKNVHTEHCCIHHGCKYNDDDCPVETGQLPQSYPCELCETRIFKVEQALEDFVRDFESDFVLDGKIVDNPNDRWGRLEFLYNQAKRALETEDY